MLDYFLTASCTWNVPNLCKSSSISFPTSWKRHKSCKKFNAFVISLELYETFSCHPVPFSATSLLERPFSRSLKAWHISPKLFTLSFRGHAVAWTMLKKGKNKLPSKVLSMLLLTFECLKWTVWLIRKPHLNVCESGWKIAQKWLKVPRKLFDIVKVWETGVRDTKRIYKES